MSERNSMRAARAESSLAMALLRWALCCLSLLSSSAWAAARAQVQPEQISLGNSVTLTIQSDESGARPDLSVLEADFAVLGQSSSSNISIVNGRQSVSVVYSVELEPRREGSIQIPAIRIGNSVTEPLQIQVLPARSGTAASGDPVYIESEIGATEPYVQQAVSYIVRLYFAIPISDGNLEVPAPERASQQQLGEGRQYQREVEGRRYNVFERHYLLQPEQSGTLQLPAPRFRGRSQTGGSGFFGRMETVTAVGQAREIQVRPAPAGAPQPWLPLPQLQLQRGALPAQLRAGEPLMLELVLQSPGTLAAQLPDLVLPTIANAQVFPEPPQRSEELVGGAPVATLRQRFAIVPAAAGTLQLPQLRVDYWNTSTDRADAAVLAPMSLPVDAAASILPALPSAADSVSALPLPVTPLDSLPAPAPESLRYWQAISAVLLLLWLSTLVWGWRRGGSVRPVSKAEHSRPAPGLPMALRQALSGHSLPAIAQALLASANTPRQGLAQLSADLDDAEQQALVQELQRALWAPTDQRPDPAPLLAQLRRAFASGPKWRQVDSTTLAKPVLPPLYPQR